MKKSFVDAISVETIYELTEETVNFERATERVTKYRNIIKSKIPQIIAVLGLLALFIFVYKEKVW